MESASGLEPCTHTLHSKGIVQRSFNEFPVKSAITVFYSLTVHMLRLNVTQVRLQI